jgi:hypothetical protein
MCWRTLFLFVSELQRNLNKRRQQKFKIIQNKNITRLFEEIDQIMKICTSILPVLNIIKSLSKLYSVLEEKVILLLSKNICFMSVINNFLHIHVGFFS